MIPSKLLEGLNAQLTELFSDTAPASQQELRNGINRVLQSAFSRLELVTREEFDAQTEVLQRTRALVEQLEQRLAELEQNQQ
jgi:BMFP domain-containing protein YqiC